MHDVSQQSSSRPTVMNMIRSGRNSIARLLMSSDKVLGSTLREDIHGIISKMRSYRDSLDVEAKREFDGTLLTIFILLN